MRPVIRGGKFFIQIVEGGVGICIARRIAVYNIRFGCEIFYVYLIIRSTVEPGIPSA